MSATDSISGFEEALSHFEASLDLALLPDELDSWGNVTTEAFRGFSHRARHQRRCREVVLGKISTERPDMTAHSAFLREKEWDHWSRFEVLQDRARHLVRSAGPGADHHSFEFARQLRHDTLGWIGDARDAERTIQAWVMESVWRDEGVVD